MTRTLCSRSRKKPGNKSEDMEVESGKENVPLTPLQTNKLIAKNKNMSLTKENESPNNRISLRQISLNKCKSMSSPIIKSVRKTKSGEDPNNCVKIITDKSILCDKTNTPTLSDNLPRHLDQSSNPPVLKTVENKNKRVKLVSPPKHNVDLKTKNHVPIYKTVENLKEEIENIPPFEKKEAVYEFEVDENEEPINKKKRKKRVYKKRPKIGPKALTINNIKYSSSESLASLPEKPMKKKTTKSAKSNVKPFTSMTNLSCTENSSCSVSSFMSHPPLVTFHENKNIKMKCDLSVLIESQSESSTSHKACDNQEESLQLSQSTAADSRQCSAPHPVSEEIVSSNHSCLNATKTTFLSQPSPCARNTSIASSHFLSSTPCKQTSAVVSNNSVFDDSYDLPNSVRQSSGFTNNIIPVNNTLDNCFGFDEPEELEEPLISPIKKNTNLETRTAVNKMPLQQLAIDGPKELKPSAQEVIELLKASIPTDICKAGMTDLYDNNENIESENLENPLPSNIDKEFVNINFRKPPRRSYERQRRVRQKSETEEESEKEDCGEDKIEEAKEKAPKAGNKCYKRINTTRPVKQPKVTKAKQRMAKEEEEMERLAAMMNAQFQEIEKVNLVVE